MNYTFDENIIYADDAMWELALIFKCHYNFIKEQVTASKTDDAIMYKGRVVMRWDNEYKKILSDYTKELKFMNQIISSSLDQENNKLQKYIKVDT